MIIASERMWRAMGRPSPERARAMGVVKCLWRLPHLDGFILLGKQPGARKVRRLLRRQQQREGWVVMPGAKRRGDFSA